MYPEYFGLKESSFSITPDPHYLFLSQQHREALAHLLFGIGDSGGFVLLTGEVGTGKTTVCRAFIEQAPDHVDIALILNPALTVNELLQVICNEFGIEITDEQQTNKTLLDHLNHYLLQAHADGRRPVLIIDEAQNLKPEVLEQIRLLTNLETSKHKLLQIFLIGQPELRTLLQKQELRQLAQRITARFHLAALNEKETRAYIQHRLAIAGVDRPLFDKRAVKQIFQISDGIPRLVNILCDRALLGAYATNRQAVNRNIVNRAATELAGEDKLPRKHSPAMRILITLLLVVMAGAASWLVIKRDDFPVFPTNSKEVLTQSISGEEAKQEEAPTGVTDAAETPQETESAGTNDEITLLPEVEVNDVVVQWETGISSLLELWEVPGIVQAQESCATLPVLGLHCRKLNGTWNNLRQYDRPALLELRDRSGTTGYLLLSGLHGETAQVIHQQQTVELPTSALDPYWYGAFTLLWKPSKHSGTLITPNSPAAAISWLNQQLDLATGKDSPGPGDTEYDVARVKAFQALAGLKADGIAGPDTLIHLNNIAALPGRPGLGN